MSGRGRCHGNNGGTIPLHLFPFQRSGIQTTCTDGRTNGGTQSSGLHKVGTFCGKCGFVGVWGSHRQGGAGGLRG